MPDQPEFDYDVFVSYSSRDKQWVRGDLLERIEKAGLRVFIDFRDFKRGAPSIKEMERGVTVCRKTLVILTPDYIESEWCEIEGIMLQTLSPANRDLRLIPLLKTSCEKPLRIGALTHIDFRDSADFDLAWRQLLAALEAPAELPAEKVIPTEIQEELDTAKSFTDADKYSDAIPILERALIIADGSGHTVARVKVRHRLAFALYEAREDFGGAERYFRDALAMVPIGDHDLKQNVLHGLGEMLLFSGRLDEAKATIHAALDAAKLSGNAEDLAGSLLSLSLLERELGFHDSASAKLDEGMQLLFKRALSLPDNEKQHHAHMLAVCYINKALLCREAGNLHEALALLGKAEKQHLISGEKLDAGKALLLCGEIHCANADWGDGFDCFDRGFKLFREAANTLWGARALEHISRLYATHEKWEEAMHAMLGAAAGAAESGHPGEQVHFLCLAAKLLRKWKAKGARESFSRAAFKFAKDQPDDRQSEMIAGISEKIKEGSKAIEKAVREDDEARDLLDQAKEIAKREHLHKYLANCLLDEAHHMTPPDDTQTRHELFREAIELLTEELKEAQSPKRRGHLMGRISTLHRELGDGPEAISWLKRAGEVFEKSGDAFGLANFFGSLAEMHRAEGRLDDEIADYRKVLSVIEGRSFHDLAAGTRINLAAALRYRREFGEAQKLLNEAEALCDRHHFNDFISAIARNRSDIETELQAAQAPAHTFPEMLASLDALVRYHPERAAAYLLFWDFAWQTELLALMRSGPHLSFMVITDDVERFMKFAAKFGRLADYFLMTTSRDFTVKVEPGTLAIPPSWRFPPNFRFLGIKRVTPESQPAEPDGDEDALPNFRLAGPATTMPLFTFVKVKSDIKGEGHVMTLSTTYLPQEAIDLMIQRPVEELIQRRAMWFPTDRFSSDDRFLTDLRIGRERGVFPVYFDRLPTSDDVVDCGGTQISIPSALLDGDRPATAAKGRRALLKLTKLPKDQAQAALLDLPEAFAGTDDHGINSTQIEIRLFEFSEIGQRLFHPAILIRE
jgi:tetratricopeptide (TPR) repeat protein